SDFTVSNISVGTLPKQVSTGSTNSFTFDVAFAPQAGSTGQRNATVEIHATENGQTTGGSVYDIHQFGVSGTVNRPPTCNPITVTVSEDGSNAPATGSCTDPDTGDTLTYSTPVAAHGTISGTAPNWTYTPTPNYNGTDSFTYTATDNHGASSTAATASITVNPVNDRPTATDGTATMSADE